VSKNRAPESPLEVRGLSVRFGGFSALRNVNFAVPPGGVHAFIGPNGAGKTTLFNCISGLRAPTEGQVLLDGCDITKLPPHRRARAGLGRSFQVTNLFAALTVDENVRLSAQAHAGRSAFSLFRSRESLKEVKERTSAALAELGLIDSRTRRAGDLSHGRQRRLEIAMALVGNPSVLLLDEPTSGMGVDDLPEMTELIAKVGEKRTVVLIEHNISLIMSISRTITVLHLGEVLLQGEPGTVAKDPRVKAAYLGSEG